jgi:preprotein translocase subunit SecA
VRQALALQGLADAAVSECFALVREVCARELGLRHYPVQLMGGYAMLCGTLAEMQTGEGKTLTAVLPAVTVALAGAPVHVITVNAYLARRDAEHLGPVYAFFGLRVGLIVPELASADRAAAYGCDVTYCVNKDVTFDYLRDRITQKRVGASPRALLTRGWPGRAIRRRRPLLLRGLHFAIVDEADSVLIDEARTPLIMARERATRTGAASTSRRWRWPPASIEPRPHYLLHAPGAQHRT